MLAKLVFITDGKLPEERCMSRWKNACEAYWWVYNHPVLIFKSFNPWIEIEPYMVNPDLIEDGCATVDNDPTKNTKMEFWVECGPYTEWIYQGERNVIRSHVYELDCGGWTWEEAVFNLAQKVLEKYGDY